MQIRIIAPQRLRHEIMLPASKSISNRVLVINALACGKTPPRNISDCDDTAVMLKALHPADSGNAQADAAYGGANGTQASAARPSPTGDGRVIDIQAAGTAMRFLTAYLAVSEGTALITGTERMKQRPIGILVDALRSLGAKVEYAGAEGFPPLRVTGGQHAGGRLRLAGNVSSQYISALLMIGPALREGLELELTGDIISRPYIDLTLQLMADFGAQAQWTGERHITVRPVPYRQDVPFLVENDWSAASYWYQMVALSTDPEAEILLPGLFADSRQGDAAARSLFARIGVGTEFVCNENGQRGIRLRKILREAERMDYDFVNQPDLAQTLAVTCAMMGLPFRFTGLQSLKIKETDRMAALKCELGKLGIRLTETGDAELSWDGSRTAPQPQAAIDTYEDHRMAMAFAPCCLTLPEIRINNPQVVSKSYPRYWQHLTETGFKIEEK